MPKILLKPTDDRELERIAPRFLKGRRQAARRVSWAIATLTRQLDPAQSCKKRKAG